MRTVLLTALIPLATLAAADAGGNHSGLHLQYARRERIRRHVEVVHQKSLAAVDSLGGVTQLKDVRRGKDPPGHACQRRRSQPGMPCMEGDVLESSSEAASHLADNSEELESPEGQIAPLSRPGRPTSNVNETGWIYGSNSSEGISINGLKFVKNAQRGSPTAVVLMCSVIIGMMSIYLTHFPDAGVQLATWKTISQGLSLVCALLLYHLVKDTMSVMLLDGSLTVNPPSGYVPVRDGKEDTQVWERVFAFARFFVFFALMEWELYRLKDQPVKLGGVGILGAHTCAFMCADAFGQEQEAPPWNTSVLMSAVWAGITILSVFLLAFGAMVARDYKIARKVNKRGEITKEDEEKWQAWIRQCEWNEDEFIGQSSALVLTQVFRFAILGHIPSFGGIQRHDDDLGIWSLFFVGLGFGLLSFLLENSAWIEKFRDSSYIMNRLAGGTIVILALTMGWCLLFWGKWLFWKHLDGHRVFGSDDTVAALTVMAVMFNALGFGALIALDKYEDYAAENNAKGRRTRGSVNALAAGFILLMGLAWECAIYEGINDAVRLFGGRDASEVLIHTAILCGSFCVIVIPGWAYFIMPHTMSKMEEYDRSRNALRDEAAEVTEVTDNTRGDSEQQKETGNEEYVSKQDSTRSFPRPSKAFAPAPSIPRESVSNTRAVTETAADTDDAQQDVPTSTVTQVPDVPGRAPAEEGRQPALDL